MAEENRKFVSFSLTFSDPWAGESADDPQDVTISCRFAKPSKVQIKRLQDKAVKNSGQDAHNLLLDVVHPDDKEALLQHIEEYPGVTSSFAAMILRGVGIGEQGN